MRSRIRIFSFFLAVFVVLGGLFFREYRRAETYRRYLNYSYQRAFDELVTSVTDIDTSLKKSVYSTSPAVTCSLCAEIYSKSSVAQISLGELPIESGQLQHTSEFISRVGDYTYSLTKRLTSGEDISDEDRESLKELSDTAGILSDNFREIAGEMNWGGLTAERIINIDNRFSAQTEAEAKVKVKAEAEAEVEESASQALSESLSHIESELPGMPRLIYDGPFSDHIAELTPKSLEGEKLVNEQAALSAAAEFTGARQDKLKNLGESDSDIDSYYFTAYTRGGNMTVQVSKFGGKVVSFLSSRKVKKGTLTPDDAVNAASGFLVSRGYNSMEPTGWIKRDGTVTVSFAYKKGDIVYYPDLIKVSVALDNGAITDFEATGYLMSHTERDIPVAEISPGEAGEKLPEGLTVKKHRMAIIPTDGKNEAYCYEFRCRSEEGDLLVYINAQSGDVEKILIVQEDDNGVLVL